MKKPVILLIFFLNLLTYTTNAQESKQKLYRIFIKDFSLIRDIEKDGITVYNRKPGSFIEVLALPEQVKNLNIDGVTVEFIANSFRELYPDQTNLKTIPPFHGYQNTIDELTAIVHNHPDICRLDTIGFSVKGRVILCLKISDNPGVDEDEAPVLFLGNHHGNEVHSVEIPFYQINYLVNNYGIDTEVTNWINNMEIWYVPMVNPDGREAMQRGNDHGVDLNRNYSFGFTPGGGHGQQAFSEPETRAIRDFTAEFPPIMSFSYHTSAQYVLHSWTHSDAGAPDSAAMVYLGNLVSESITVPGGHYQLVQGGRWYFTAGEYCDYMYVTHNTLAFTIELGTSQVPDYSVIPEMNEANLTGWKTLMRQAGKAGVTGLITDAGSGMPVPAIVEIPSINNQGFDLTRRADSKFGRYYRFLQPGIYTFQISAPGYRTIIREVTISPDSLTNWNVRLERSAFLEVGKVNITDSKTGSTSGNGDGKINVGEMIGLTLSLDNVQTITASKVYARISSPNPRIQFITDSLFFGTIDAHKSKTSGDTVLFRIDPGTPDGDSLDIRILVSDSAGFGWIDHTVLEAFTPKLEITGVGINDTNGNRNGAFDNGETVFAEIRIANAGRQDIHGMSVLIAAKDPYFKIDTDQDEAEMLPNGHESTFRFQVSLPADAPKGHFADFTAEITSVEGFSDTLGFQLNNINGFYDDFEKGVNGWVHASYGTTSNSHDDWQLGTPAGKAADPVKACSGVNCWGNDMGWDSYAGTSWDGFYQANVYNYLKSPKIDCSDLENVGLKFMRWLNVRISDFARIRVNDQVVWENGQSGIIDNSWKNQIIDISAIADHNPSVVILFELESNSSGTAGGWNIDDVIVGNDLAPGSTASESVPLAGEAVLYDSWPNPFAGLATIPYYTSDNGTAELAIYDQTGNRIRVLVSGYQVSGMHQAVWDGKNENGQLVPSGIYFYRLQTEKSIITKRLITIHR
jgi:hypothetical protein